MVKEGSVTNASGFYCDFLTPFIPACFLRPLELFVMFFLLIVRP